MSRKSIIDDPMNLAYHIIRSVPHDAGETVGNKLFLVRGDEVMICRCVVGEDTEVSVGRVGVANSWRSAYCNDTDTIARLWS